MAAGGQPGDLLPAFHAGTAIAVLVNVESVRTGRQTLDVRMEHDPMTASLHADRAHGFMDAVGGDAVHLDQQMVAGNGRDGQGHDEDGQPTDTPHVLFSLSTDVW